MSARTEGGRRGLVCRSLPAVLAWLAVGTAATAADSRMVVVRSKQPQQWAICAADRSKPSSRARCYSPDWGAGGAPEVTSWEDWGRAVAGLPKPKAIEVFQLPPGIVAAKSFSQQVQFLAEGRRAGAEDDGLLDAATLQKRSDRTMRARRRVVGQGTAFSSPREQALAELRWKLLASTVVLAIAPFALLALTRWQSGRFERGEWKSPRQLAGDSELLRQVEARLDQWSAQTGERPRRRPGEPPILDKLGSAMDLLVAMKRHLGDVVGYDPSPSRQTLELSARILAMGEPGKPASLVALSDELRELRRLRDEVERHRPRNDSEALSQWVGEIAIWLTQTVGEHREVLGAGAGEATGTAADLRSVREEMSRFDHRASGWQQLRAAVEASRIQVGKLVALAETDRGGTVASQLQRVITRWEERKDDLHRLRQRTKADGEELAKHARTLKGIADLFPPRQGPPDEHLVEQVRGAQLERSAALRQLSDWDDEPDANLERVATRLTRRLGDLERELFPREHDGPPSPWHQRLEARIARVDQLELDLLAAREGNPIVADYLNVTPSADDWPVLSRERRQPQRALRLAVLAALARWEPGAVDADEQRLREVLGVAEILAHVEQFVGKLEDWPDADTLWSKGFAPGFGGQWLHNLLRAEAVLDTFYRDTAIAERLGVVRSLAEAFRGASRALGRAVQPVRLLAAPPSGWTSLHGGSELIHLVAVREQVRERARQGEGFIVDVKRFAVPGEKYFDECQVLLYNLADWDASQERES